MGRDAPGANNTLLVNLVKNTSVLVFAFLVSLHCSNETQTVSVFPKIIVRELPSLNSKQIGELDYEQQVEILDEADEKEELLGLKGTWKKIKSDTKTGWVFGPLLRKKGNEYFYLLNENRLNKVSNKSGQFILDLLKSKKAEFIIECSPEIKKGYSYLAKCDGEGVFWNYSNNLKFHFVMITDAHGSETFFGSDQGRWELQENELIFNVSKNVTFNNYSQLDCYEFSITYPNTKLIFSSVRRSGKIWILTLNTIHVDEKNRSIYCSNNKGGRILTEEEFKNRS